MINEQYQCIGCGAVIQTENPQQAGYLPNSALQKGLETGQFYCQRCHRLRHYNELMDLNISEDVFLEKLSQIAEDDAYVLLVVDIFDVEGSLITGLQRFIGHQSFSVVANKIDLLPKVSNRNKIRDWVRQTANRYDLRPDQVILAYGTKRQGIHELVEVIEREIKRHNIYIVGVTNVGKSTLINQLIQHYGGESEIVTTSNHPGTTLDMIQIPLTESHSIIDTPGIIKKSQYAHYLSREELANVLPTKPLKPKSFQLKGNQTLFVGGLARLDIKEQAAVTLYMHQDLYIHRTKTERADEFYQTHRGELLTPPHQESLASFPTLFARPLQLQAGEDINISGLGWLTVNRPTEVIVWTPRDVNVTKRPAII